MTGGSGCHHGESKATTARLMPLSRTESHNGETKSHDGEAKATFASKATLVVNIH
jgi:hypothetical protein